MLKVGDKVTIVDDGEIYSTHFSWINRNYDAVKYCLNHFVYGRDPSEETVKNSIWTIIHIATNCDCKDEYIAFIDNGDEAYMIGLNGIEEVETETSTVEELLAEAIDIIAKHHELSKMEDNFLKKIKNR